MMVKKNLCSAKEIIDIISKQWATTNDIMKVGGIGKNKALDVKLDIIKDRTMPNNFVPMKEVVEYFNIDIKFLQKFIK